MVVEHSQLRPAITTLTREGVVAGDKELEVGELLRQVAKDTWGSLQKMSETRLGVVDNKIWPDKGNLGGKTSPADIGLTLSAALAMRDLREITDEEFEGYVRTTISVLEQIDRCKQGLYYNWYNTKTGQVAQIDRQTREHLPAYIPAVDNSILAVSLMVIRNASKQAEKAQRILSGMNFPYLYDYAENMFHGVGNDRGKELSDYYLDMLLSESRLTTYVGVSEYGIPPENYLRLGRVVPAPKNNSVGVVNKSNGSTWKSWGGTLFEVTLPTIFVPEMEWGPESFDAQYKEYLKKAIEYGKQSGVGIWSDPCDDVHGIFRNYGSPVLGLSAYGQDGTETPSAMFSALSIAPEEARTAIFNAYTCYPEAYKKGYGFRDSIRIGVGVTPTCLSYNQARTILHIFNAVDPEGGIYKYTSQQFPKIRTLIENESPYHEVQY